MMQVKGHREDTMIKVDTMRLHCMDGTTTGMRMNDHVREGDKEGPTNIWVTSLNTTMVFNFMVYLSMDICYSMHCALL